MFSRKSFVDRATEKFKKPSLLRLLLAPGTICAAYGNRISMTLYTVSSTAGTQLKVVLLNHSDNPRAMMFLPDQSLLVIQKGGVLWLLELEWQSPGKDNAAAETVPSVVRRMSVAGSPDIHAVEQGQYGHHPAILLGGMAAEVWSLDHHNPLDGEKRVSQTLH